jgi:hypothetical protein
MARRCGAPGQGCQAANSQRRRTQSRREEGYLKDEGFPTPLEPLSLPFPQPTPSPPFTHSITPPHAPTFARIPSSSFLFNPSAKSIAQRACRHNPIIPPPLLPTRHRHGIESSRQPHWRLYRYGRKGAQILAILRLSTRETISTPFLDLSHSVLNPR